MELLQLKYFCDAAETDNFSKTAKKFLVPTSNISQSVKRLENELGSQLFDRSANKIVLNDIGKRFYATVKPALDLICSAQEEVMKTPTQQTIKINSHINRRVVMSAIEKFQKKYPDVSFIATHTLEKDINNYDIVITDKVFDTTLVKNVIAQEELLLAYNKELFDLEKTQLKDCPFITMNSGSSIYNCTQSTCNDLGFSPRIVLQSEDPFYIRKCIELGLGIAIVPELSWRGQYSNKVALKKIGNYKRPVYAYKKHTANEYINKFYDLLTECFAQ